jgi:hypothetical protein
MRGSAMIEAEGVHNVPLTDRRSFLRRAVTALAAGAAVNATAIVATRPAPAADIPQEDPAIIALGERIGPLLAAYRNAADDRLKARANAEASCPAVPEELVSEGTFFAGCTTSECDVEGREVLRAVVGEDKYARRPRQILNSEETKAAIARGNLYCNRRTKFGKKLVRLIETAEKYETERATAIERSGLDDARSRQYLAAIEVEKLAFEAFEIEPRTMAGVLVHARALNACAETDIELGQYRGRSGQLFGNALAQSVTRLSIVGKGGDHHV